MHRANSFITLTYDDQHYTPTLNYRDFQLFLKRLRKTNTLRYFMCGEYGNKNGRAHYHALLFGKGFTDRKPCGNNLYRSEELEHHWPHGFSSIGDVTYDSAAYVARYSLKKRYGNNTGDHYNRLDIHTGEIIRVSKEFAHMSLKPGLGYTWFTKYWEECSKARDGIIQRGGRSLPLPKYYDALLEITQPDLREYRDYTRYVKSGQFQDDCTPERLAAREHYTLELIKRKESMRKI